MTFVENGRTSPLKGLHIDRREDVIFEALAGA